MKKIKDYTNILTRETIYPKPKNWTRKKKTCNCNIPLYFFEQQDIVDRLDISFKLEYFKHITPSILSSKYKWYDTLPTNSEITHIKLPKILEQLDDYDFEICLGKLKRDKIGIPTPIYITIFNIQKYKTIVIREKRKEKLKNIL